MKLLYKATRDYLLASISILLLTGGILFFKLRTEVSSEMDEQLILQADVILQNAQEGNFINTPFSKIEADPLKKTQVFGDTFMFDRIQKETEEYHYLQKWVKIKDRNYRITAMTAHIGWDRYYLSIIYIFALMAFLLTGTGVLINYFSNKKIWRPFFKNLEQLKTFSVRNDQEISLTDSSIQEFKELNAVLRDLTDRSRKEYLSLREFTENASHEIQTPLSIIQTKLDRISQIDVSHAMAEQIIQAKSGVDRLSKLSKDLLLLTKIENQLYNNQESVRIDILLEKLISNLEDLFDGKGIQISKSLSPLQTYTDPYLAETLLINLLNNALRYTPKKGQINISITLNSLCISNNGSALSFPKEQIFLRFVKSNEHTNSTGLGLSIIFEICQLNHWNITYDYRENRHFFTILFDEAKSPSAGIDAKT